MIFCVTGVHHHQQHQLQQQQQQYRFVVHVLPLRKELQYRCQQSMTVKKLNYRRIDDPVYSHAFNDISDAHAQKKLAVDICYGYPI